MDKCFYLFPNLQLILSHSSICLSSVLGWDVGSMDYVDNWGSCWLVNYRIWIVANLYCYYVIEGLLLGNRNGCRARRFSHKRRHLGEAKIVGTDCSVTIWGLWIGGKLPTLLYFSMCHKSYAPCCIVTEFILYLIFRLGEKKLRSLTIDKNTNSVGYDLMIGGTMETQQEMVLSVESNERHPIKWHSSYLLYKSNFLVFSKLFKLLLFLVGATRCSQIGMVV